MQKFRKLLSVLLLSGALLACDNINPSEGTSEQISESIKPSETTSSSSSDDSSISEIVDTQLILEKQEAVSSLENYLDLNDYRQAEKEEITSIIESAKESIESAETIENVQTILANAKAQLDEVKTDAQLSALEPKIFTSFENGQVFTNSRATLDVFAKNTNGEKLSYSKVTVKVNGQVASINWDDNVKTSYNFVFQEGENLIEVTVVDGDIILR